MALDPLTMVGIGTSAAGALGSLFGGGGDSGSSVDRETGNANSANALNFSLMDYIRGQGQNQKWEDAYAQLMGNYTGDRSNYEAVRDPYTALLQSDIANAGAARSQAMSAGSGIWSALSDMVNGSKGTFNAGLNDINQALQMASDVYRPAEKSNINWLNTTGRGAMEGAYSSAQDNLGKANTYLGQANDFYNYTKEAFDPEQTATMGAQDVNAEYDKAAATAARQTQALGIDPSSGASRALDAQRAVDKALAVAGARSQGRVTGTKESIAAQNTGLSAVGNAQSALNSATGTLGNAAANMGNFGVSYGNLLRQGPSSLGTSVVSGLGSFVNNAANSYNSLTSTPLSSQLANAMKTVYPDMATAAGLGTTMGKLGAESMSKIYDATKMANDVSMGGSSSGSDSSGYGFGQLLGGGLGMLSKGLSGSSSTSSGGSGGIGDTKGGITVRAGGS